MEKKDIFHFISEWLKSFIFETEDEAYAELTENESKAVSPYEKRNSKYEISKDADIVLFDPASFDEAERIGDLICSSKICCVNMHKITGTYRQRILDFLSGVAYGTGFTVKKIGKDVYLYSPELPRVEAEARMDSGQ